VAKLDGIVARRRLWCSALSERLDGTPGILLPKVTEGCDPSWWFYMMLAAEGGPGADAMAEAMREEGMPIGAHYIGVPVYDYPLFASRSAFARGIHAYMERDYRPGLCPNAERILRDCLILAINEGYTEQDLDETVTGIRRACASDH